MLQSVHDCKKFYWGTKWVPGELVIGGGPTLCETPYWRLNIAHAGLYLQYGCVGQGCGGMGEGGGPPHIVVERCLVFLCILHCCTFCEVNINVGGSIDF